MSEWLEKPLIDLIDIIGGGTPKTSITEYWNGNIPWLSVVDFNTGLKYVKQTEKTISTEGLNNSSTKFLDAGDIIISARGTVGALAVLSKPMTFNQSCYGIRAKKCKSINNYIYYLLKYIIDDLKQISHGGVFDTITKDTFKEIIINIPSSLTEQKAIASILSSLDNKIDLLHCQNKTLEAMAETLFRQWFVEELDNRKQILTLGTVAVVQNGYAFSSKDYITDIDNCLEVLKMGHIDKEGGLRSNPKRDFVPRSTKLEKWVLSKNDIVMAMTDMKDNVVILGVPALIDESDKYVLNQRVARIYLKNAEYFTHPIILYMQLKNKEFIAELQSKASSGVQVNLSTEAIKNSEIFIPNKDKQETLGKSIVDIYKKVDINLKQIKTLENLRDTLLPKLMSGEVRVAY